MDYREVSEYSVSRNKLWQKMDDMGCNCVKAQVMAHIATSENSERHKLWSGFPKTLEYEKWGSAL